MREEPLNLDSYRCLATKYAPSHLQPWYWFNHAQNDGRMKLLMTYMNEKCNLIATLLKRLSQFFVFVNHLSSQPIIILLVWKEVNEPRERYITSTDIFYVCTCRIHYLTNVAAMQNIGHLPQSHGIKSLVSYYKLVFLDNEIHKIDSQIDDTVYCLKSANSSNTGYPWNIMLTSGRSLLWCNYACQI